MQCSPKKLSQVLATAALIALTAPTMAAETPRLQFTNGDVQIQDINGILRPAIKGDFILPGEKIITGDGGMAQLRVFKQGVVALKAKSEITIEPPVRDLFSVKIDRGLIRTVTKLAKQTGVIDVITPGANIAVDKGDALTGVSLDRVDKVTHNQVLDGKVEIQTGDIKRIADVGKVLEIAPNDGAVKEIIKKPDAMILRVPEPTLALDVRKPVEANDIISKPLVDREPATFSKDLGKIARFQPERVVPTKPVESPISKLTNFEPAIKNPKLALETKQLNPKINPIEKVELIKLGGDVKTAAGGSNFGVVFQNDKGKTLIKGLDDTKVSSDIGKTVKQTVTLTNPQFQPDVKDSTKLILDTKKINTCLFRC